VLLLIQEELPEDMMSLARSVYETYLHMVWVLIRPDQVLAVSAAREGLMTGTHEFEVTPKSRVNRSVIVHKQSGGKQRVEFTAGQLAQLSGIPEDVSIHEGVATKESVLLAALDVCGRRWVRFWSMSVLLSVLLTLRTWAHSRTALHSKSSCYGTNCRCCWRILNCAAPP
jgi:hypothetical protein